MKRFSSFLLLLLLSCGGKAPSPEDKKPVLINSDKEVVCFIYHRFGDSRYPTTNVSVKDFEAHLKYLAAHDFRVINFSDAIKYLQSDEPPQKTAVITIDDGYKSFYQNGLPLLKKFSVPATLFINTKTVGGGDYMDWAALKEAMKNNVEIGNHTHSHDYFLNEDATTRYKTFEDEIEQSQSIITKNLGVTPVVFSYPYGEFDIKMKDIVKKAGFLAAAAQNSGVMGNGTDLYNCPRFPMSEAYSGKEGFAEKAAMHSLKIIKQTPEDLLLPPDKRPLLTLTLENNDLVLDRLQCFVQGGECQVSIVEKNDKQVTLTLQAAKNITSRRRTLYTITIPDKAGRWHWFSRLWINEKVE